MDAIKQKEPCLNTEIKGCYRNTSVDKDSNEAYPPTTNTYPKDYYLSQRQLYLSQ